MGWGHRQCLHPTPRAGFGALGNPAARPQGTKTTGEAKLAVWDRRAGGPAGMGMGALKPPLEVQVLHPPGSESGAQRKRSLLPCRG